MNINRIKKKIQNNTSKQQQIIEAKKYYENITAITEKGVLKNKEEKDPLRNADNRINHNFHELLVDEKVSYMFTYPMIIDIDNNVKLNEEVKDVLGDEFERKIKNLAIEASNCGTSWLHYWIDDSENKFKYGLVDTEQIIPTYSNGLERDLESIIRHYACMEYIEGSDEEKKFLYVEYWTKDNFETWKFDGSVSGELLDYTNIEHTLGDIPFIEFANNKKKQSDLSKYKHLIDLYNIVMSGFANDLEDIQQVIYILENYGGEDLNEFLGDLKRYKAIKTESGESGGSVKTLQIDIPIEARKVILEILKKQIYESGQALQQDVESVGNASGVALKFFYRKLELKAGLLETEFRSSINKFIRAILKFLKLEGKSIQQTYTRNMISNDLENAQIAKESCGIIPEKYIIQNHPWIDNIEEAMALLEKEKLENKENNYEELINKLNNDDNSTLEGDE